MAAEGINLSVAVERKAEFEHTEAESFASGRRLRNFPLI
jgi:hypothetical protein